MSSILISAAIFACMVAGVVVGRFLQNALPDHHLEESSKDTIKIASGLIATLTALVLGLLVSSASGSFNTQKSELEQAAAGIILLDRTLAQYGPEAAKARALLREGLEARIRVMWPEDLPARKDVGEGHPIERLEGALHALSPATEAQKGLQSQALGIAASLGQARWLLAVQHEDDNLPLAFIVILGVWTAAIFTSFSLFAPRNATVAVALLLCIASVTCAVFLIIELGSSYSGVVQISSKPLQTALEHMGKP